MKTGAASIPRVKLLVLACVLALAGFDGRSSDETCSRGDILCDGKTLSIVFCNKKSVHGHVLPNRGYLLSRHEDAWLVDWSLQNGSVDAPVICYVGKYEEERAERGSKITRRAGHPSERMLATDRVGVVLMRGTRLKVLGCGVEAPPATELATTVSHQYVFTRTRSHVFSWQPHPAIYSLPDMKLAKKIESTDSFREFVKLYSWRENSTAILTEGLGYLIAVPWNGASESEQGQQHTKAFCYQIERDEVSTVSLTGLGDASIRDAQPQGAQLHWFVQRDTDEFSIMDSESRVIAEFTLPKRPPFGSDPLFWDPTHNVVWLVQIPHFLGSVKSVPKGIVVNKFNVTDGSLSELKVPFAELDVP